MTKTNPLAELLGIEPEEFTKTCRKCSRDLPLSCFRTRGEGEIQRRVDIDCIECQKRDHKIRRNLKKTAPPPPDGCDICGKPAYQDQSYRAGYRYKTLCLDHDHKTGKFRGWICDGCNVALSRMNDDVNILKNAIKYLEKQ